MSSTDTETTTDDAPAKRGPGRPKGVKNKPKAPHAPGTEPIRRRRAQAVDTAAETAKIVAAALLSRQAATQGVTQEDLTAITDWARGVRAEAEALKGYVGRPRRQKAETYPERIARFEMNRALLDGILAGTIAPEVQDGGPALRFTPVMSSAVASPEAVA